MSLQIEHWDTKIDGELTETAMRQKLQSKGFQVSRYVYPPGTCFPDHSHHVAKIDAVLSGQFMMRMAGQSVILHAGDTLGVPRGAVHSAEVLGDEPVVSLDAVKN